MPLQGLYSVTDYGADPTGVADSTTAVHNAIAAAAANGGGAIWFPAGQYRVNIVIDSLSDIGFVGYGVKLLSADGISDCLLLKSTPPTEMSRFSMMGDWWITGPPAGTGSCIHIAVTTISVPSYFENIQTTGGLHGFFFDNSITACNVNNLTVLQSRAQGILISGNYGQSNNCFLSKLQVSTPGQTGIEVTGGIGHRIETADIEDCALCVLIDPSGSAPVAAGVQDIYLRDVTTANPGGATGAGIKVGGGANRIVSQTFLQNCVASGFTGNGIEISTGVDFCRITNPQSFSNANGIVLSGAGSSDIRIQGAALVANTKGFWVSAPVTEFGLHDSYLVANTVGIQLDNVAADYFWILNNSVHGNTTPIANAATGTHQEWGTPNATSPGTNV